MTSHDEMFNRKIVEAEIDKYIDFGGNPCYILESMSSAMRRENSNLWNVAAEEIEKCIVKLATIIGEVENG